MPKRTLDKERATMYYADSAMSTPPQQNVHSGIPSVRRLTKNGAYTELISIGPGLVRILSAVPSGKPS
ncbi:MAG: hypothetical protein KAY65_04370 [Planctomycetes bacterium]|nr:hypothetical protein [Planctomycetota bacterium]